MDYKVFIISIERNKKRYQTVYDKLKEQGFDPEVFIGVDYKHKRISNKAISPWGIVSPKSVLACAASHVLLWKHISTLDIDFALIVEDDSYVYKDLFDKYLNDFKPHINDNTFLNLSTSLTIDKENLGMFSESHIILALDTYLVTPGLCKKLFDYYKNNGLSYHIDLHLTFVKNEVGFKMIHFNKKITEGSERLESSMVSGHEKVFVLKALKDSEIYKELNTPIIEISNIVFNGYRLIVFLLFILVLTFTFYKSEYFFLTALAWFILGCCVYDV